MALTNSQYDMLMRMYQQRQLDSVHQLEEKKELLYNLHPEFLSLEQERSEKSLRYARLRLEGDATALERGKAELRSIAARKTALLKQYGYPADYLEPVYRCSACKDTGYIDGARCTCLKQAAIDLIYTQSNLKGLLETENFTRFSYDFYPDNVTDPETGHSALYLAKYAVETSLSFIRTFDGSQNLFFYGNTGVGKTFLTHCIARELLLTSHSVLYFSADSFFRELASQTFQQEKDILSKENYFYDCDLLIIDDLGTEMTNSFTVSSLFSCLNERILRKKSTVISTNLGIKNFRDFYSERVFSRITSNFALLKLHTNDIRLQKKLLQTSYV